MILVNGDKVSTGKFPNNEVWIDSKTIHAEPFHTNKVTLKFEDDSDLLHLGMIKQYLDTMYLRSHLTIAYMPYSRMDRENENYLFSLKYIAKFINGLCFDKVTIYEPHSDVTPALIDNCIIINQSIILANDVMSRYNINCVYFPDAGAQKRYSHFDNMEQMVGFKKRDFKTGSIVGLDIIGNVDVAHKNILIIDDLCSKGGSFIPPAKQFKEQKANQVFLVVTHCEDNIFNGDILKTDYIDKVFTTNSILTKEHNKINIERIF